MYLSLSTADFPLDILDAHFLTSLVVVVVPFALREIDGGERRVGLDAGSLEITLKIQISFGCIQFIVKDRMDVLQP